MALLPRHIFFFSSWFTIKGPHVRVARKNAVGIIAANGRGARAAPPPRAWLTHRPPPLFLRGGLAN
jgi:hypothetical protein